MPIKPNGEMCKVREQIVEDDASVDAAFAASEGAQPHRTLSMAFRRLVDSSLLSRSSA